MAASLVLSIAGPADDRPADPAVSDASATPGAAAIGPEVQAKIQAGEKVYQRTCIACHQATGQGIPSVYPPLAQSDYLIEDLDRAVLGVIKGQSGEMTVRGAKYNLLMPPQMLKDDEIAQVLTYVLHQWGNPGGEITEDQVSAVRARAK
jgi:nitrite reductase (NO-forming)